MKAGSDGRRSMYNEIRDRRAKPRKWRADMRPLWRAQAFSVETLSELENLDEESEIEEAEISLRSSINQINKRNKMSLCCVKNQLASALK